MNQNSITNTDLSQDSCWSRAASLGERLSSLGAVPGTLNGAVDVETATRELEYWRSQPPFAESPYFAERLSSQGLTEQELFYCLGEKEESLHGRMVGSQKWLIELLCAFSGPDSTEPLPIPESLREYETTGFLNLVGPLLRAALTRVQDGAARLVASSAKAPFDPRAISALLFANLPGQLLWSLSQTLVLELHVARVEGWLQGATAEERFQSFLDRLRSRDVALALLHEYPVLAKQLVVCVDQWVDSSLEFLQRFATDRELICTTFSPAEDPGELAEVQGGAGDGHHGGRSVQIVKFTSGLRVVYKPRSMSVDAHFQDLLACLNQRGDYPAFRTVKVLDRETHGWMEFVTPQGCQSAEEIERFYRRQGAYLALLHALEACDFHSENLMAAGEHPVLVDLESLFHPPIGGTHLKQEEAAYLAGSTMGESVVRVGLLPQRIWSNGESAGVDISGLGALPGQLSPMAVPRWEGAKTDEMRLIRRQVIMPNNQNRPSLNGQDVDVLEQTNAIIAGFTSMYNCLVKCREGLLADEGPLARFEGDQVRAILRATSVYGSLLRESYHPDLLRDGLDRDRLFDRLWGAVPDCPHLKKVIRAEYHDLQNGDIPFFTTRPDSRDLWTSTNECIANFFEESAMDRVRRRLRQMGDRDYARQIWFIRASMAVLSTSHGTPRAAVETDELDLPVTREHLLSAARAIGDRIEALALPGERDVSWIGLTPIQEQHWTLSPLGLDLYDGLPGVAMFLAYLGKLTGESRYTTLAQAATTSLQAHIKQARSSFLQVGGFTGWGGVVYALVHFSALWERADLLAEAEGIVAQLSSLIERDEQFDLIGGSAGCIGGLLALYRHAPSSATLDAAKQCGHHLIAHATPMPQGVGWLVKGISSVPLTGFSHGAAGVARALVELATTTGDTRFLSVASSAIDYERSLFSPQEGNWRDLRDLGPQEANPEDASVRCGMTWCHGAPGIGLAYLHCLTHIDDGDIRQEIDAALQTTLTKGFGSNHSLCHGDLGNLEILLEASLRLEDPRWQIEVDHRASAILKSIEQHGWLCGNPVGVETPGLMTGLAGIGYELLRLAEPTCIPSVLVLAPPVTETAGEASFCPIPLSMLTAERQ